ARHQLRRFHLADRDWRKSQRIAGDSVMISAFSNWKKRKSKIRRRSSAALPLATLAMLIGLLGVARAATITVGGSISQALAAAKEGDTLIIAGGRTFHEHVVITNSVRLLGTNSPVI